MDSIERLCALLAEETAVFGELEHVLREEQDAVVHLRPDAILVCLEQRDRLQERLGGLAAERRGVVRDLAAACGATTSRATEVLPLLPGARQPAVRGSLRSLRQALLRTQGLQRQNGLLVGAGLDTVGELLRTLRALVPGARYGADATVAVPTTGERLSQRA